MAFFGLEQNDLLEREKQKFLQGGEQASADLPEFTWGEESYDGLGTALQEGGDDFNDETFGGSGPVGATYSGSSARWRCTDGDGNLQAKILISPRRRCLQRASHVSLNMLYCLHMSHLNSSASGWRTRGYRCVVVNVLL